MTRGRKETIGKTASAAGKQLASLDVGQMRQRKRASATRGFLGGILLGVAVGVLIALLTAPRRGDETRRIVSASAAKVRSRAIGLVHQVRSEAEPVAVPPRRDSASAPAIERTFGD